MNKECRRWLNCEDGWMLVAHCENAPERECELVWEDSYIKLFIQSVSNRITYLVQVDRRRKFKKLQIPKWVTLFFGANTTPSLRTRIKPQRIWHDRQVIIEQYGTKPPIYFIIAR